GLLKTHDVVPKASRRPHPQCPGGPANPVTQPQLPVSLGKMVARALFECGGEGGAPATRIQFMMGSYADGTEEPTGGFIEPALARFIDRVISAAKEEGK